jgi:hypothetical protein
MMEKLDLRKEHKALYSARPGPDVIEVPELNFIMVDGKGDPNTSSEFISAIEALYGASFSLKFMSKKERGLDWTVMALEGLWWADDMEDFDRLDKSRWKWTLMIMQPHQIGPDDFETVKGQLRKKKDNPAVDLLRMERYAEGSSVQVLHVGPFSAEGPAIMRVHEHIKMLSGIPSGKHHEIYLSDTRRVPEEKWKTIIRQPFTKIG